MNKHGFTLIEVLVSVLIITAGVVGAFFIYRTSIQSYIKVREHNLISRASLSFLSAIDSMDLSSKSKGEGEYGKVHYSWKAKEIARGPVTVFKSRSGQRGAESIFTVTLFSVSVKFECGHSTKSLRFNELSWIRNE